ncbi:Heat shock protein SSB1 [Orchesella cincta]|uniref:Heat shock protein SSB1 n=1 Tax=Orchesella cincta TaxID=48709 RepID=A0A1D2M0Y2_ORCCI|nr:Heat shock protein SSB1 [Orchesella cincta]
MPSLKQNFQFNPKPTSTCLAFLPFLFLVAVIAVANAQYYGGYMVVLEPMVLEPMEQELDIPTLGTAMADILVLVLGMEHTTRSRYLLQIIYDSQQLAKTINSSPKF